MTAPDVEVVTAANVEPSEGAFSVLNLSECVFMLHVCLKCYDDHLGCPVSLTSTQKRVGQRYFFIEKR